MKKIRISLIALLMLLIPLVALASSNDLMNVNDPTGYISATTSSANVSVGTISNFIIVINGGPDIAYIRCGNSSITAASTDTKIPANSVFSYRKRPEQTYCAALSVGTSAISFQYGSGE